MPGFYHVLSNPLQSTAFDGDADPADDDAPDTGTAAQILRKVRRRKIRRRVRDWLAAQACDPQQFYVQSADNLLFLIETDQAIPALPAAMEALFAVKNAGLPTIRAYKAANAANWP